MKPIYLSALLALALLSCSKSNNDLSPAPPPSTSLQLTVVDEVLNSTASGITVKLYTSFDDWQNNTHIVASATTDGSGKVKFTQLQPIKYYWFASNGCRDNTFKTMQLANALPSGMDTRVNTSIASTGMLGFVNTSNNPYKIYVDGVLQFSSMAGNSTATLKSAAGVKTVRVVQLSGYGLLSPTDKTYTGVLNCGGTLTATFP